MEERDVVVIGAGLLGCFAARALTQWEIGVLVLESREDVCTGISRANSGIVYTGCDTAPGTLKTRLCVRASRNAPALCRELGVRFSRCGSLMVSFGPRADGVLRKKLAQGIENGVSGLRLLPAEEVYALEPNLAPGLTGALYAPDTGTVDPWELGIAAFENARANGADFRFRQTVTAMRRRADGYELDTPAGSYAARVVINCAGLHADSIRELVYPPAYRIFPTAADYLVLDDTVSGFVRHVIFHEPEEKGKGLTLIPTVDGNLLAGPTRRPWNGREDWAAGSEGIAQLRALCETVTPGLPLSGVIRSFAALRPNPFAVRQEGGAWVPEQKSIPGFLILEEQGLLSLLGIKTPGLTCAAELGKTVAERAVRLLGDPRRNPDFTPSRTAPPAVCGMEEARRAALVREQTEYGEIVCRCREVSRGEISEAIRRGAVTLDGVKRRTGTGMGRCQGGRCMQRILEMLSAAQGVPPWRIDKDGAESPVLCSAEESGEDEMELPIARRQDGYGSF